VDVPGKGSRRGRISPRKLLASQSVATPRRAPARLPVSPARGTRIGHHSRLVSGSSAPCADLAG